MKSQHPRKHAVYLYRDINERKVRQTELRSRKSSSHRFRSRKILVSSFEIATPPPKCGAGMRACARKKCFREFSNLKACNNIIPPAVRLVPPVYMPDQKPDAPLGGSGSKKRPSVKSQRRRECYTYTHTFAASVQRAGKNYTRLSRS